MTKKLTSTAGVDAIRQERLRQIEKEGWDSDHDREHTDQSLAMAASLYAAPKPLYTIDVGMGYTDVLDPWPWWNHHERGGRGPDKTRAWDKREQHSRLRQLEIAGALIAAEIDRLLAEQGK